MDLKNELIEFLNWYNHQNNKDVSPFHSKDWVSDYEDTHKDKFKKSDYFNCIRYADDYVITLELAKEIKAKGFNIPCKYYWLDKDVPFVEKGLYHCKNGEKSNHNEYDNFIYSAPTVDEYDNWLKN